MRKIIGVIGGLSPESTASYYLHITRSYAERFGDYHYPEIVIVSVDLEQYHDWRSAGQWDAIAADLARCANKLQRAGADFGVIATNTMHKVFRETQEQTSLPLLSLFDPLIRAIRGRGLDRVGLLGTLTTMSDPFYAETLAAEGVQTLAPSAEQRREIHRIIVEELVRGVLRDDSRAFYLRAMNELAERGAQGVILGCTEIPLLVGPKDTGMVLFDTATLHADAALNRAIE